ncbi:MAG: M1 family metallopeptidase [Phycisphaerales bacterium]|nr:M1 family metallopeptidase [Phycisphaerales bacterium]
MSTIAPRTVFASLLLSCGLAAGAAGFQAAPHPAAAPFDQATGRDQLNYPRHTVADFLHMKLNILVPDMNQPRMEVIQDLSFVPIGTELDTLKLDAKMLAIHSITSPGRAVTFEHDGAVVRITLDPPVPAGHACTITTTYTVTDPPFGAVFFPESPEWPGRAAQMHTKGAPENNSYWFPCHDFPNDRLTTEILCTVPAAYDVVANGRMLGTQNKVLTSRQSGENTKAEMKLGMYRQFHWLQDKPHPPYLVVMAIGRWEIVDVGSRQLPMPVYVPPGRSSDIKASFGRTPEMADFYGRVLDEPYPWDQYAQIIVWNFSAGGMENTGATTLADSAIYLPEGLLDGDPEALVAHEIAHQWFGDLITCNSWEHTWLNEGWATYCEALWFDHRDGPVGYESEIIREFASAMTRDKADAPRQPPMASKQYRLPNENFRRAADPYSKGSSILHMLRKRIGDEAFFRGTALYIDRYKFKQPETADFQVVMEEVSGESLDQFFDQWCFRPGHPELDVTASWDSSAMKLHIAAAQTQKIDGYNPAFEFDLPVLAGLSDGQTRKGIITVNGRDTTLGIDLPAEPVWVAIDPDMHVLAKFKIDAPEHWLAAQATKGPTLAARIQALKALGASKNKKGPGIRISEAIAFNPEIPPIVRAEAVRTLRSLDAIGALETCVIARPPCWEVRDAAVDGLAAVAAAREGDDAERIKERAADMFAKLYTLDKSSKVRASCIRGLGRLKSTRHLPLIVSAMDVESQSDRVRQAALVAVGDLAAPEGLAPALKYAGNAGQNRTRPIAIENLVKLAKNDPDETFKVLADALVCRDQRARNAAGRAFVDLGDPRGLELLEQTLRNAKDYQTEVGLTDWIADLRAKLTPKPDAAAGTP